MEAPVVLVADGQRLFAEALGLALGRRSELEVLGVYPATGGDAVDTAMDHRADVVLLDYWIPGMNGPAATRALLTWSPGVKVLLLSWYHGPNQVQEGLLAGAAGFLPKSITFDQLVDGILRAHAGEPLVYAKELARLVDAIEKRAEEAEERAKRLMTLTQREVEILQHLCQGRPAKQVAGELHIAVGTLKNHVHKILAKTGARTQLEAINMARYEGLIGEIGPPGSTSR